MLIDDIEVRTCRISFLTKATELERETKSDFAFQNNIDLGRKFLITLICHLIVFNHAALRKVPVVNKFAQLCHVVIIQGFCEHFRKCSPELQYLLSQIVRIFLVLTAFPVLHQNLFNGLEPFFSILGLLPIRKHFLLPDFARLQLHSEVVLYASQNVQLSFEPVETFLHPCLELFIKFLLKNHGNLRLCWFLQALFCLLSFHSLFLDALSLEVALHFFQGLQLIRHLGLKRICMLEGTFYLVYSWLMCIKCLI